MTHHVDLQRNLDLEGLRESVSGNRAVIEQLLQQASHDLPARLDRLEAALRGPDAGEALAVAHATKGLLASVRAGPCRELVESIEHAVRHDDLATAGEQLIALHRAVEQLLAAIREWLSERSTA